MRFDISSWLKGWWIDILVIIAIFFFAFLRWVFVTFEIRENEIVASTSYFGILKVSIPFKNLSCVSVAQGGLYRLFKAYKVYFDTNSGNDVTTDLVLTMSASDVSKLQKLSKTVAVNKPKFIYTPRKASLVIFSLLFSSTLSGVLIFSTFLIQSTKIVGKEIEQRFFTTINTYADFFTTRLPRYVVIVAIVIVSGWLFSFCVNIVRHWKFTVTRQGDNLFIKSGFVTRRYHLIPVDKINYIDIQQSLLMKIFNICSVHIHASGYGKDHREIAVLIPITTLSVVKRTISMLVPEARHAKITLRPRLKNIMRYILPPIVMCTAIPVAGFVGCWFLSGWREIFRFTAIVFELPAMWLLVVKTASIFTTGVGAEKGFCTLSYCKWYKFHTVIVKQSGVSRYGIYQTPFQHRKKNVSFFFNIHGESKRPHRVKNFPLDKGQAFIRDNF